MNPQAAALPLRASGRRAAGLLPVAAAAVFACLQHAAAQGADPPARLEIKAVPIEHFEPREPARRQFGALRFRGGLELSAPHKQFGGLSGIRVMADGGFVAITDRAHWIRGRIVYRGEAPAGITGAEIAPMLDVSGKPLAARGWYDTEGLTEDGGALYVSIERVHRIVRFDYARDGLLARAQPVPVPPAFAKLPSNRGIECLAAAPRAGALAGGLIAISERALDAAGHIRGFIVGGKLPGEFSVRRIGDFDIVDCALLPEGGLIVLERHFTWRTGVAMRMRRIGLAEIRPGALLDGPVLIEADLGYQIDNMEGLSAHRAANGETVLTLVSDDNFSIIQRTILLQFALVE